MSCYHKKIMTKCQVITRKLRQNVMLLQENNDKMSSYYLKITTKCQVITRKLRQYYRS